MSTGAAQAPLEAVPLVRRALDALEANGLEYCHWKSNEHVDAAVAALTDLDVLFAAHQRDEVERVLWSCGFKPFLAAPQARYRSIYDYIGLDESTLRIVHIHAHYELRLGEAFVKSYHLPWERRVLSTRLRDAQHAVAISEPHLETLLLLVRAALKLHWRKRLKYRFSAGPVAGGDLQREFLWLKERIRAGAVAALAEELLNADVAREVARLVEQGPRPGLLGALRRRLRPALRGQREMSAPRVLARSLSRKFTRYRAAFVTRVLGGLAVRKRTNPRGGIIVVVLGMDGAGKSTVIESLRRIFSTKLDVDSIYMGSGDGRKSLLRTPLSVLRRLARGSAARRRDTADDRTHERRAVTSGGIVKRLGLTAWAVTIALEKRRSLRRAARARALGQIVLCDRYPQRRMVGIGDGPLLPAVSAHPGWLLRALTRWEDRIYARAESTAPDLVLKLHLPVDIALLRKPGQPPRETLERKGQLVRDLAFPGAGATVDVDATQPPQEVVRQAASLLWARCR